MNCSLAVATAHEHLRVAHSLDRLPKTNEGFESGVVVKALEEIMRQQDRNSSAEESEKAQASFSQKRADAISSMSEHFIATATVDDENGGITLKLR